MDRKEQCKEIWRKVFNDDESYIDWYFSNIHKNENLRTFTNEEIVLGMVYENPYRVDEKEMSRYLVAAGVLPCYRGEGVLKKLMLDGLNDAYSKGLEFIYLSPVDNLIYKKYGYSFISDIKLYSMSLKKLDEFKKIDRVISIENEKFLSKEILQELATYQREYLEYYNLKVFRDENFVSDSLKEIFCDGGIVYITKDENEKISGYMSLYKNGEDIFIKEFFYKNINSLNSLFWIAKGYGNYFKNISIQTGTLENLEDYFKSDKGIEKKIKNKIQIRIVNVEKALERVSKNLNDENLIIKIEDSILKGNEGSFKISKNKIEKTFEKEDLEISIEDLPQIIYGYRDIRELLKREKIKIYKNREIVEKSFIKRDNYFNQDF